MPNFNDNLGAMINGRDSGPSTWTQPTEFDLSNAADRAEVTRRIESGAIAQTHDALAETADDLFELRNPDQKENRSERESFIRELGARGLEYGSWFHFGWDKTLVRYPDVADFRDLKTFRNKNVVTQAEQDKMYDATVGVMGLSVGSSVVDQLTMAGIGGTQVHADFDTLAPSNLNRIRADFSQVGMSKIDIVAQKVSKSDPYIAQLHLRDGITEEAFKRLADAQPDLLYDEMDDLQMKAQLRQFAAEYKIPVVMATDVGDTSIIDVERHDLGDVRPFNGRLSDTTFSGLIEDDLSDKQRRQATAKIVGVKNASPRLIQSMLEVNKTLGGLPQLGTTAALGGALAAVAGREIIVGRKLDSGRYTSSMKETLHLQSQVSLQETVQIFRKFLASNR